VALTESTAQPRWRRTIAWLVPRPAGRVVLLFWGYVILRLVLSSSSSGTWEAYLFRPSVLGALLLVVTILMIRDYARMGWPEGRRLTARLHWAILPVFCIPAAIMIAIYIESGTAWLPVPYVDGTYLTTALVIVNVMFTYLPIAGLPPIMLWLAMGQNAKQPVVRGPAAFAWEWLVRALDAARDWLPPAMLILGYNIMAQVLVLQLVPDQDALMARIDRALFLGHDPVLALQAIVWAPLSEWLAFAYASFMLLFPICFAVIRAKGDLRAFRELAFAITLTLAIGYITYTVVPVTGPVFTQKFDVSVDLYYFRYIKEGLIDAARIERDCFPSLHTAISLVFLWSCFRHARTLFWILLPVVLSIPLACVYFRYHWVIDLIAGGALTVIVALVTPPIMARYEHRATRIGSLID
jgi:membrane-associated phospholipid phosphatase